MSTGTKNWSSNETTLSNILMIIVFENTLSNWKWQDYQRINLLSNRYNPHLYDGFGAEAEESNQPINQSINQTHLSDRFNDFDFSGVESEESCVIVVENQNGGEGRIRKLDLGIGARHRLEHTVSSAHANVGQTDMGESEEGFVS